MKLCVRVTAVGLWAFSGSAHASDPTGLLPFLLGCLVVLTLLALGVSRILSLLLVGTPRLFVCWLPVAVLWAPVPVGKTVLPAAIVLLDFPNMVDGDVYRLIITEVTTIALWMVACIYWSRSAEKKPNDGRFPR